MSGYVCEHAGTKGSVGFSFPAPTQKLFPDRKTFMDLAQIYDYVPVYITLPISGIDMAQFYRTLHLSVPSCLFESLSGRENGRFSVIACNSLYDTSHLPSSLHGNQKLHYFLDSIRMPALDLPFFSGGLVGFWAYEDGLAFQELQTEKSMDYFSTFFMPGTVLVYDRHDQIFTVILWCRSSDMGDESYTKVCRRAHDYVLRAKGCRKAPSDQSRGFTPAGNKDASGALEDGYQVNMNAGEYCRKVQAIKELIRQGEAFQVVLSRRWEKSSQADPWNVYLHLREINPSPYMFYLCVQDLILMGASPEMQLKIAGESIKSRPIAGTRRISGDRETDRMMEEELKTDEKEKAEHLMLVDLSRNDIGRVSRTASVKLGEFMQVERFSHVMHMVSTVEGQMREGLDSLQCFQACFPAGTLSGAPKHRAMEIIDSFEDQARGVYGGAVGYVDFSGNLDTCITIRTLLYRRGKYSLQSGAGIVADSVPEREEQETLQKAGALMQALKEAEADDSDDRQL